MSLSREQFERIVEEEFTPIPKRILNRILDGKTNEDIRKDETVWYDLDVYEFDYHRIEEIEEKITELRKSKSQKTKLQELEKFKTNVKQLEDFRKGLYRHHPALLDKHLRAICDQFRVKSTRNVEDDLLTVMKYFAKYKQDRISARAADRFELLGRIPYPGGSIPTYSLFYQYRYDIYNQNEYLENKCLSKIENAGKEAILIRIKGPHLMGKTSFKKRLLNNKLVMNNQARVVDIDLATDDSIYREDLDFFYKSLCRQVCIQLELDIQVDTNWDSELTQNSNFKNFFENHILPSLNQPLFLSLDNLHKIFEHKKIEGNFTGLLRDFHEQARENSIFRNLILTLAYSTDDYPRLDINQSPLANVGEEINLIEFNKKEIKLLSKKHELEFYESEVDDLISMVGGHPYLIRLAMYHVKEKKQILTDILAKMTTNEGIYSKHLTDIFNLIQDSHNRRLKILKESKGDSYLKKNSSDKILTIKDALKEVVTSGNAINLDNYNCDDSPTLVFQLYSTGLVAKEDDSIKPRCHLYREYFSNKLRSYNLGQDI